MVYFFILFILQIQQDELTTSWNLISPIDYHPFYIFLVRKMKENPIWKDHVETSFRKARFIRLLYHKISLGDCNFGYFNKAFAVIDTITINFYEFIKSIQNCSTTTSDLQDFFTGKKLSSFA